MNKWEHTQTSLKTLGTKLEMLGSKAKASTKELKQQRGSLRPTGSTGHKCPGHPEASRAAPSHPATSVRVNLPPSGYLTTSVRITQGSPENGPRIHPKLSIDGSPKPLGVLRRNLGEMRICPKNFGLKLPTTPRIVNPRQEHYELGFIQKSTNRRPNPVFEESRSSTKRHKALTHDPLKEIQREMPSNWRIERRTKIPRKGSANHQKGKQERQQIDLRNHAESSIHAKKDSHKV
jgi:hypothetical protein